LIEEDLRKLLNQVQNGSLSVDQAVERLKNLPFEDLGYAKLDHHRTLRRGYPEAVFCEGKSNEQIKDIISRMMERNINIVATRANKKVYDAVKDLSTKVEYNEKARTIVIKQQSISRVLGKILIITAGTADIPVAEEAAVTADIMGNEIERLYDVGVSGIHRLLAHKSKLDEANVIIVVAGMEGALPSVVAGLTSKPVIAVPTSVGYGASFGGLAALLAMLNSCASGVSVVNIDNGYGAAYMASQINRLIEEG
jgi:NCAIR mutase (PurE)-related protein